jgi:hypothetical protein
MAMSEQEWLSSDDPSAMLAAFDPQIAWGFATAPPSGWQRPDLRLASDRKLRLFVEACRAASGHDGSIDLDTALLEAVQIWSRPRLPPQNPDASQRADFLRCIFGNPWRTVTWNHPCFHCNGTGRVHVPEPPYIRVMIPRSEKCRVCAGEGTQRYKAPWLAWHDGLISTMAQQIYEERRFDDLPVLADALEEAGCNEGTILEHARSHGPHVRGCWVIDCLLGES